MEFLLLCVCLLILLFFLYVYRVRSKARFQSGRVLKLCAVLGSGGHTMEMFALLAALPLHRFSSRMYVVADTDLLGMKKIEQFENAGGDFEVFRIPRSREVKQSFLTAIYSTLKSILFSVPIVVFGRPDVLLVNGPGTCVPVVFGVFLSQLFFVKKCRIVFVESLCRVESLSLTGKLLYHLRLTDNFVVQWPDLQCYSGVTYMGRLS